MFLCSAKRILIIIVLSACLFLSGCGTEPSAGDIEEFLHCDNAESLVFVTEFVAVG